MSHNNIAAAELQRRQRELEDERLKAALERSREGETDWESLRYMLGRNELPSLLQCVWTRLPHASLIEAVSEAWSLCEFPEQTMPRREWLPIFQAAGYHDDGKPAVPPADITLWRGGVHKTRMAWTADREQAEFFQHRYDHIQPGRLWTVNVGAHRLLAHYHTEHRREDEHVIDPTGLRPKEIR